ncbi:MULTISPECIES: anacyclamide/piricyclamide family prenylated cyclic peptide [unclassified Microcoleus]|uniref:anacyclamide/piricyclamide family prenylated cyclic peptide n=1 Tax=unclassified Microcoleus TaxID=2642155 RepID=UPI002FD76D15
MTKKNLRPQQVAPVQRETTAKSSVGEKGASANWNGHMIIPEVPGFTRGVPFAGDDAE